MRLTPALLRFILNIYGPYLGACIHTDHISPDWRNIRVSMKLRWYNRNAMGTHFGGSLYSMVDPHLMLMLMNILGNGYVVWDKSATIDFLRPGRGRVFADFTIDDRILQEIRTKTEGGDKYLPVFTIDITDERQELVARVIKTLYVRKKTG
jgi:acyl-coenzyme A thioesterase PaaI-like protein